MLVILLLLSFLPPVYGSANCIDWDQCKKTATCFSKYASADVLGIYDPDSAIPKTGLSLLSRKDDSSMIEIGIEIEKGILKETDNVAITVGSALLGGCYKDTKKQLKSDNHLVKTVFPPTKSQAIGAGYCCIFELKHFRFEFLGESSSRSLAVNITTGDTTMQLRVDFAARLIFESLDNRKNVDCPVKMFRVDPPKEKNLPYYPFQRTEGASCGREFASLWKGAPGDWNHSKTVPMCYKSAWTYDGAPLNETATSFRCRSREYTMRRSCAGQAPPSFFPCGNDCGKLNPFFFKCENKTFMKLLTWNKEKAEKPFRIAGIDCTEDGFVYKTDDDRFPLPPESAILCEVAEDEQDGGYVFLTFSRVLAIIIGFSIYVLIFLSIIICCKILFNNWRERVEEIGPLRAGAASSRTGLGLDKDNNGTPSQRTLGASGRSSKKGG